MRNGKSILGMLAVVLLLPDYCLANPCVPLVFRAIEHLAWSNLLIGIVEGLVLAFVFKRPKLISVLLLIAANYFSAWVGWVLILNGFVYSASVSIQTVFVVLFLSMVVAYFVGILLEFPFVVWVFRKQLHWLKKSIYASLLIQTVSYILLACFYLQHSSMSMVTQTDIVDVSEMELPDKVILYYISAEDGDVYSRLLGSGKAVKACDFNSTGRFDRVEVRPTEGDTSLWDLCAVSFGDEDKPIFTLIKKSLDVSEVPYRFPADPDREQITRNGWDAYVEEFGLGEQSNSRWQFYGSMWPDFGISVESVRTDDNHHLILDTPLLSAMGRHLLELPGDVLLFELDRTREICIYDPNTRQLAVVAEGYGVTAILQDDE